MYWFTADEHFGHANIIRYCDRPFDSVDEMDVEIMARHNEVVGKGDVVVHAGDFCFCKNAKEANKYLRCLNGQHILLYGSHDKWMPKGTRQIWTKTIEDQHVVVCHYAMRRWPLSHHGSWQLYGHSHGKLAPEGLQYDVGVDNNDFYPVSFAQLKEIFEHWRMYG